MKKLTALALVLLGVLAGRFAEDLTADAQQNGDAPSSCGDVNGDGNVELSDAVFLLNRLFLGGPELRCPAPPPSPGGSTLPQTGQTICYDGTGTAIPCDDPGYPGQDGFYQTGCGGPNRFVDLGDGTIEDTCTSLVWLIGTVDRNEDGAVNEADQMTWQEALNYCENLDFAGCTAWRLPNSNELMSLMNLESVVQPELAIAGVGERVHWTSSSYPFNYANAVTVHFASGGPYPFPGNKLDPQFVLAVRDSTACSGD